jgi:prepilin peptidase CpaA
MASTSIIISVPFAAIMALAAATDLRDRRIPNVLTVAGVVVGPVLWGLLEGPGAAFASVVGGACALLVGLGLFMVGAIGGGDAKLLAVTGAFLGPARLVNALLVIGITGGLLALVVAVARGRLLGTVATTWSFAVDLVTHREAGKARGLGAPGALTIPYGVAIAAGSLLTWFALGSGILAR